VSIAVKAIKSKTANKIETTEIILAKNLSFFSTSIEIKKFKTVTIIPVAAIDIISVKLPILVTPFMSSKWITRGLLDRLIKLKNTRKKLIRDMPIAI
jgi:hypothetical protein